MKEFIKNFMKEFKEFISKGNVMDMAVGIIIGGAFTSIVTSLVDDIISPILGLFGGMNFDNLSVKFLDIELRYGKFITSVITFLIMAFVIFVIMRALNSMNSAAAKLTGLEKQEEAPTTKKCPYCKSEIAIDATRCPHCTSHLEEEQKA